MIILIAFQLGLREEIQNQDGSIDNLRVIVFDDDTTGIRVGDNAKIVGDIRLKQDRKSE